MRYLHIKERDTVHRFDADGLTAMLAKEFRRVTGHRPVDVIYPSDGWDIDTIAELIWLHELASGGTRSLADIEGALTYRDVRAPEWVDDDDTETVAKSEKVDPQVADLVAEVRTDPET